MMSCDDNELDLTGAEPFFKIKFINQDSLDQLTIRQKEIKTEIGVIDDSVAVIDKLVADGDETDYSENLSSLKDQKTALTKEQKIVNANISSIKSGKVQLDKVAGDNGEGEITYEDSLTSYKFPLNSNTDISQYFITIDGETYTLEAIYSRETVVKERTVTILAKNFAITSYSFDTIKISQRDSTNFSSHEATVTAYF